MSAYLLDLFIDGGFRDFAFLDVHNQPVVSADKTNLEALFKLVPLTANHDAVAIAVRLWTGHYRADHSRVQSADALKDVAELLVLDAKLGFICKVLVLAAAAVAEIAAQRLHALR